MYPKATPKIEAAPELVSELEDITDSEKKILAQSIDEIERWCDVINIVI
ncbi:MAG TPA: hypothetical protein DHV62_10385 [Elusimicrobia bacterium]|nr:hypothetical protein [Elusimicrobiota bacterium]